MKRNYRSPRVTSYGSVGRLTAGSGGSLPDFDGNGNLINNNCVTETFVDPNFPGITFTRTECGNAAGNT